MRKTKLYIDTSVISEIVETERGRITSLFFEFITDAQDEFEIFISTVLEEEINESNEDKKEEIYKRLDSLSLTKIEANVEAEQLALMYVNAGILSGKHIDDLRHIAYAVISHCDFIVSWNMKHLTNYRTIQRVDNYNMINNLSRVNIITPNVILGE